MRYDIPLARPNLTQAEIDAVVAVLRTPNLSLGPKVKEFEAAFAKYCQTRHAIACSSGTAGLHMVVRALGLDQGDEVITTPFSFIASSNAVVMERAKPVFVDIDPHTWNIDPQSIATAITARTKAVLAVDVFGQPADYDAICGLLKSRPQISIIEDSCEALGSRYHGAMAGSLARVGVFGFYPNKQLTTGEGGMVVTDDDQLANLLASLRNQGRDPGAGWLSHARVGYNYRLSDISCALGLAQLKRIDEIIAARARVHGLYKARLAEDSRLLLQRVSPGIEVSWFVMVVRLADDYDRNDRDDILEKLREKGIACSNYFAPIHLQPAYTQMFGFREGDFPICESTAWRTIALPFHHELSERDVDCICTELQELL